MDLPPDPTLDVNSEEEEEDEPDPGTSREASTEWHWGLDQGMEGFSPTEQPQLS